MNSDISSTNPVVKAILEGTAPRPAQLAASRGILPLPQVDLLEILVGMYAGTDAELKENARQALTEQNVDGVIETIRSDEVAPAVLAYYAAREDLPDSIQETILSNTRTPAAAVVGFATKTQKGSLLELLAFNQQLLIQNPAIIEAIIANPNATAEASRRATELKREFFEKERGAQQIANELRAQGNEAAAEFLEQSDSDLSAEDAILLASMIEVPDQETDDSWLSLEYIEEIYEETEDQRQATVSKILNEMQSEDGDDFTMERVSMINRVMQMGVKDRVKLGMKGDREARNILIRDPNKLVSSAVINNPRITEQEVESIASMRSMSEEILRQIAANRQWARNYNIGHTLAKNPRTPIGSAMTIMTKLQLRDLSALSKNRNVSEAVRKQALRLVSARSGGRS